MFATENEPLLYAVSFLSDTDNAVPVVDLTEVIADEEDGVIGGGQVSNIVWDPAGYRLVVAYKHTSLLSVFSTKAGSTLAFTPCGWIRGQKDEFPTCMEFQVLIIDIVLALHFMVFLSNYLLI